MIGVEQRLAVRQLRAEAAILRLHGVESVVLETCDHPANRAEHLIERAQIVIDDRLSRKAQDPTVGAKDHPLLAFTDRAGLDLTVFLIRQERGEIAHAQQARRLEIRQVAARRQIAIGRRGRLVAGEQNAVAGVLHQ